MSCLVPPARLSLYFRILEHGCSAPGDFGWIEETLDRYPKLAQKKLPGGELPLRTLLNRQSPPGLFKLLTQYGAEHDIITAAASTDVESAERLLRRSPQLIDEVDGQGNTPLHWACVGTYSRQPSDTIGLVRALLAAGACTDAENVFGHTPLDRDLLDGSCEACLTLLENGASPNVLYGVMAEDFEFLDELLDESPDELCWRDRRNDNSLLHLAVRWGCTAEMFQYLTSRGAPAECRAGPAGVTPLLLAIKTDNTEAAQCLIMCGAKVNALESHSTANRRNFSALSYAVSSDYLLLAEMLIARGAETQELGPDGETLLCCARSPEMVELLTKAGLDAMAQSNHGWTALDYAAEEGLRELTATLLRHGFRATFFHYVAMGDHGRVTLMLDAKPELVRAYNHAIRASDPHPTKEGRIEIPSGSTGGTALHYAVKAGVSGMVELLLQRGADANAATTPERWTPLHDATYYAIMNDLPAGEAIIRILISAGADLSAKTWGGYRPVDVASYLDFRDSSAEIFELLRNLSR